MFSCASNIISESEKENNPPDDGSDPLVTADNTTCEEFSRSEDDTLNGNKEVSTCIPVSIYPNQLGLFFCSPSYTFFNNLV